MNSLLTRNYWEIVDLVAQVAAVLFIIRWLVALGTRGVPLRLSNPILYYVWSVLAVVGFFSFLFVLPNMWPPLSLERKQQRQEVFERVQRAGGWEAIRAGCQTLAANHPEGIHLPWLRWHSNVAVMGTNQQHNVTNAYSGQLPEGLALLKPMEVNAEVSSNRAVIKMRMFGMHSTGGHSTPYYGLEIALGNHAEEYEPRPGKGGASGNSHFHFNKITNGVFEIY